MTSCSWPRMGCRTTAFKNLARPRRRFSMKAPSLDRWLPLTATRLGGSSGRTRKGYRLCRQSSIHTKSLYRRVTLLPRLALVTS